MRARVPAATEKTALWVSICPALPSAVWLLVLVKQLRDL